VYRSAESMGKRPAQSVSERVASGMVDASGHSISGRESLEQPNTPPAANGGARGDPHFCASRGSPMRLCFCQTCTFAVKPPR